ncbi:unnamed protein product [Didymodactylos carnosus]|uniref:Uncharacterized protein n=1 Tax=Didymodactylos carnosus TaxID=1234261 RepID=A0A813RDR6_9BILA|nr:unnamed protein product [Didymodactylos carnosus]CAF0803414.1 unnamed protein product [Didymodactylos carnosus]CAF3561838.1 unnamed protein product [Didymodactylos carnosus]CAF3586914.1 unnamed protein product [Didymodactylos carnosus]
MKDHRKNVLADTDESIITHNTNEASINNSPKRSLEDYEFSKNSKKSCRLSTQSNDSNSQTSTNFETQNDNSHDKQAESRQKTKTRKTKQKDDKLSTCLSASNSETKMYRDGNDDDSNLDSDGLNSRKATARLQPINYVNEFSLLPWDRVCPSINQIMLGTHQSGVFAHEILSVQQELEALLAMSTLRETLVTTITNTNANQLANNELQSLVRHQHEAEHVYGVRQFHDIASKFQRPFNPKQQQQFYRQVSTTVSSTDRFWLEFQSKYSLVTQTDLATIKDIYLFDQLLENEIKQLKQEYLIAKNMEQVEHQKQPSITSTNLSMDKLKEFLQTVDSQIRQSIVTPSLKNDEQQSKLEITAGRQPKKEKNNITDVDGLATLNLNQFLNDCDKEKYDVISRYVEHTQLKQFQQRFHSFITHDSPAYKTPTSSPPMKLNSVTTNKQSPTLIDNRKRINDSVRCSPRLHFQDSNSNSNPTNFISLLPVFQQKNKQEDDIKTVDVTHEPLSLVSKSTGGLKRKSIRQQNIPLWSLSPSLIKAERQQKAQLVADYLTNRTTVHLPVSPVLTLNTEKENNEQQQTSLPMSSTKRQLFNNPPVITDTLHENQLHTLTMPTKTLKRWKRHKKQPYGKIKTIPQKKSSECERTDSFECKISLLENLLSECKTLSLLAVERSSLQENIEKVSYRIQQLDEQIENVLIKIEGDGGKRTGKKKTYSTTKHNLMRLLNDRKIYEQALFNDQAKLRQLKTIK